MTRLRTGKSTIGRDPWEAVIPAAEEEPIGPSPGVVRRRGRPRTRAAGTEAAEPPPSTPPVAAVAAPVPHTPPAAPPESAAGVGEWREPGRSKLTVHLDHDLVNRVKNAAYWNPRLTIARIAETGIRLALERVEKDNGGPYPQREADLVGGRPIK